MSAFRLRWLAAAALFGSGAMGAVGACGGDKFTLIAGDGGGASDSGGGDDAAPSDAGADAESPSFCALMSNVNHLLCDDFDRATSDMPSMDPNWDGFMPSPTADGRIDKVQSFSPPRSLSVYSTTATPGLMTYALFEKVIGHAKTVSLAFQVMVEAYGGDGTPADGSLLASITFGAVTYTLVAQSPTILTLGETLTPDGGAKQNMSHAGPAGLGTGRWINIQLQLTLPQGGTPGSFSLVVGTTGIGGPLTYPTGASPSGALLFGFYIENAVTNWRIRYDNVVLDKTN